LATLTKKPDTPLRYRVESIIGIENYGTAMNEGRGRIPDVETATSTYRYADRGPKYVQDAMEDMKKVAKHRGWFKGIFGRKDDKDKKE